MLDKQGYMHARAYAPRHTHEHIIHIAFLRQQSLQERASMSPVLFNNGYTYTTECIQYIQQLVLRFIRHAEY
jgi:hypothetical protein